MTDRAVALAREHGVGVVALGNTNHWMRGGAYGWRAAEAGMIGVCWTNTMPNLPAWGATVPNIGNNPLVVAVPRADGGPVVLDMAMSQFSYGALEAYRRRGEALPVPGGFDADGALTTDPGAIEASGRPLPIGYWKGAGLAIVLDMVAALLADGRPTHRIAPDPARETELSQVFVAIDPTFGTGVAASAVVSAVVDDLHRQPEVRYPGERTLRVREESLRAGVPVDDDVWARVRGWAGETPSPPPA
jgi:3-dehydro-L-gulonate 2-dehydrogenase